MKKGRWYWIRLEGDGELQPAQYDGEYFIVNGLSSELWPAEILSWIRFPGRIR